MNTYDTKADTITVEGITYDVERAPLHDGGDALVLTLDGEEIFEGLEGRIGYDDSSDGFANPRDWSNVGVMFCDYRGYTLGDEDAPDPRDQTTDCDMCDGTGEVESEDLEGDGTDTIKYCPKCDGHGEIEMDMAEYLRKEHGARVIMPLYVYEHSGITIRAGKAIRTTVTSDDVRSTGRFLMDDAGWDTSMVGFVFDTPERVKECMGEGVTDEQIEEALDGEVKVYASYLEGDVTYYSVEDSEAGYYESCGGYVGDSEQCESDCFDGLVSAVEKRLAENIERELMAARDIITV